jgi:hypothetical protein
LDIRETKRLLTQKRKIIAALKDAGSDGLTNVELNKISMRFGGHIGTLRREGYKIQKINLDGGLYKYILIAEPSQTKLFATAREETLFAMAEEHGDEIASYLENYLVAQHFNIVRRGGWYEEAYFGGLDNGQ